MLAEFDDSFITLTIQLKNKNMGMGYLILAGAIMLFSWLVSSRLKSKFEHYSKLQLQNGMTGAEIAEKMLADNGTITFFQYLGMKKIKSIFSTEAEKARIEKVEKLLENWILEELPDNRHYFL